MYKIYSLIILFLLTTGCSNDELDVLAKVKQTKLIRVGMDLSYPPFETTDKNNKPYGISVDIAYKLGNFLSYPNNEIKVEIVNTDFKNLIPALNQGAIDVIIGSMGITDQRKQSIDFSKPYMYFKLTALLNKQFAENNFTDIENITTKQLLDNNNAKYVGLTSQLSSKSPVMQENQCLMSMIYQLP